MAQRESLNKTTNDPLEARQKNHIEHQGCNRTVRGGKGLLKEIEKTYRVSVIFIPISEDAVKIKLGIIEDIIRKGCK